MNNLYPNLTQLSNIFNLNNYCLMKSFMFLISLYGKNINNGKMSIGVANSSDRNIIARFVYSKYDLVLKE